MSGAGLHSNRDYLLFCGIAMVNKESVTVQNRLCVLTTTPEDLCNELRQATVNAFAAEIGTMTIA